MVPLDRSGRHDGAGAQQRADRRSRAPSRRGQGCAANRLREEIESARRDAALDRTARRRTRRARARGVAAARRPRPANARWPMRGSELQRARAAARVSSCATRSGERALTLAREEAQRRAGPRARRALRRRLRRLAGARLEWLIGRWRAATRSPSPRWRASRTRPIASPPICRRCARRDRRRGHRSRVLRGAGHRPSRQGARCCSKHSAIRPSGRAARAASAGSQAPRDAAASDRCRVSGAGAGRARPGAADAHFGAPLDRKEYSRGHREPRAHLRQKVRSNGGRRSFGNRRIAHHDGRPPNRRHDLRPLGFPHARTGPSNITTTMKKVYE